jgi:hypothetical protein
MPNKSQEPATPTRSEILMLGYLCVRDKKNLSEMVEILDRFCLGDPDIATICGCTLQSVYNARQKAKNKKKIQNG